MEKEIKGPEMDTEKEDAEDKRTEAQKYSELLIEAYEVSLEAQRHLHLFKTRPECALLILEDYLKEIQHLCDI